MRAHSHLHLLRFGRRALARLLTAIGVINGVVSAVMAAECPRPGTLGTSRLLDVSAATTPRVGLKSFPATLPLADKEVVLTFDDGPWPRTTDRVLQALANECVKATFFLIGQNAAAHPEMVRRIATEGHTVAHHTWSHRILNRTRPALAREEIDKGIAAVEAALQKAPGTPIATPFFRFPGFASTPALLDELQQRKLVVFGADLWASDWVPMTPAQELQLIIARLTQARRGIVLFHDTKAQTAAMLPGFLHYLRTAGYRVVHLRPAPAP